LKISKELFQDLLSEAQVFPKLSDYVINFRWKMGDPEIGPTPMRFKFDHGIGYGT
jgi:hypothetical protein